MSGAADKLEGSPSPYGYSFSESYENDNPRLPTGWLYFKRVLEAFTRGETFKADGVPINPKDYETVCFDPWTSLGGLAWNYATAEYLKDGGKNSYMKYQVYLEEGRWFVEQFKYLHSGLGYHVVVTFHVQDKDTNSSGTVLRRTPYMEGRALPQVMLPAFDELWALEGGARGDKFRSTLYTQSFDMIDGLGSRHGLPAKIVDPNIGDIISGWRESATKKGNG